MKKNEFKTNKITGINKLKSLVIKHFEDMEHLKRNHGHDALVECARSISVTEGMGEEGVEKAVAVKFVKLFEEEKKKRTIEGTYRCCNYDSWEQVSKARELDRINENKTLGLVHALRTAVQSQK